MEIAVSGFAVDNATVATTTIRMRIILERIFAVGQFLAAAVTEMNFSHDSELTELLSFM